MAGRGPAPKRPEDRARRNKPTGGEWQSAPGEGWQHGAIPRPPDGLLKPSRDAWEAWFRSWWAAHWSPDDLPGLRQVIRLFDALERGEGQRAGELRLWMDNYGITPAGQQARRWARPQPAAEPEDPKAPKSDDPYRGLRVV